MIPYVRQKHFEVLQTRLQGSPNLMQVVIGPRQVGKTTIAHQIRATWKGESHYATADTPDTPSIAWIEEQWHQFRKKTHNTDKEDSLLILDEVQKVPQWSRKVKQLFDEDRTHKRNIRILLLGSSALLMQRGLTESLAGRFELHRHFPWSFGECREYFGLTLEEHLFFGGYPAGLELRKDEQRWKQYMRDALIETVIGKDLLLMAPVRKPALLRQTFGLATAHPAEILSYQKMLGSLHDAGNATTIASYLTLLSQTFLLTPVPRWSGSMLRQRGSQPKIVVHDNGIVSSMMGMSFEQAQRERTVWGRLVENAVGAQLLALAEVQGAEVFYWRVRQREVDYVVKYGQRLIAIEVKTGAETSITTSLSFFQKKYKEAQTLLIAKHGDLSLEDFFMNPEAVLSLAH